jgi:excinuclease ABC subunit A
MLLCVGATATTCAASTSRFRSGLMTCVTGVSGSGKSTLINDTLYRTPRAELNGAATRCAVRRASRAWSTVRQGGRHRPEPDRPHAALQPGDLHRPVHARCANCSPGAGGARARLRAGRFSFNVKGGRCEACQGDGLIKVEMHFLPDVYVPCDVCQGKRYNRETLEIRYKGQNIHDVLEMTVEDALELFAPVPMLARKLQTLMDVGLATSSSARARPRCPAARRSASSCRGAVQARHRPHALHPRRAHHRPALPRHRAAAGGAAPLRDDGNTVVVIEHNLDVIKTADWIIDLGPKAATTLIACGTPEQIATHPDSHTGHFLRPLLGEIRSAAG